MSLKELTAHKHKEAESTAFMKELMSGHVYAEVWTDFIYQKWVFYKTLECLAGAYCNLNQVPAIHRTILLFDDYKELAGDQNFVIRTTTKDYNQYLLSLAGQPDRIMAHVYVWHMGDLFGGQMIKRLTPGQNKALEFDDKDNLAIWIRQQCNDDMAEEAIVAFDWAIKIMNELF